MLINLYLNQNIGMITPCNNKNNGTKRKGV